VTVDSLDEETQTGDEHSNTRRRRRCTPLCVCVPATFLTLFVVFAGTMTGAIISWHHYEKLRLHDMWIKSDCTILSKEVRKSNLTQRWRSEARVKTTQGKVGTGYWGRTGRYTRSKQGAEWDMKKLPPLGGQYPCYVRSKPPQWISLAEIERHRLPQEDVYLNMAWGASFFAAVSGFLLLTLGVNFVQRALVLAVSGHGADGREGLGGNNDGDTDTPKRPECLSPTQTRWVVAEYGESIPVAKMPSEWTCSICLEDADNGQVKLRVVVLPCSHRFHTRCIRRWLRRGSPTCPLCNFDLSTLFNEDGLPVDADGNALNSPTNAADNGGLNAVVDLRNGPPNQ